MRGAMNFGEEGGLIWGIIIAGPDGKPTAAEIKNRDVNWILTALYPQDLVVDSTFGSARAFNQCPTTTLPLKIKILDSPKMSRIKPPAPKKEI